MSAPRHELLSGLLLVKLTLCVGNSAGKIYRPTIKRKWIIPCHFYARTNQPNQTKLKARLTHPRMNPCSQEKEALLLTHCGMRAGWSKGTEGNSTQGSHYTQALQKQHPSVANYISLYKKLFTVYINKLPKSSPFSILKFQPTSQRKN